MDINYLLHRHQTALMLAQAATNACARDAHHGFARGYAEQIATFQALVGAHGSVRPLA